jgi:hypothetical protein
MSAKAWETYLRKKLLVVSSAIDICPCNQSSSNGFLSCFSEVVGHVDVLNCIAVRSGSNDQ